MITRIQARNYRCFRDVDVALDQFHVLVGPNASGKSTLFDLISFVGDFIREGLEEAVAKRTYNFQDLVWNRPTEDLGFELALDVAIPSELRDQQADGRSYHTYRYEIAVKELDRVPCIVGERATLIADEPTTTPSPSKSMFATEQRAIALERDRDGIQIAGEEWTKEATAASTQVREGGAPFRIVPDQLPIDPQVSHLRFVDKSRSPVSAYVHSLLTTGTNSVFLDSGTMRQPSPFTSDKNPLALRGAKLPWTLKHILENDRELYEAWLSHVQVELEDLTDVRVVFRPEDRAHYLMLKYNTGVEIPSWMVSDGTLRFMAIMLAAYMADRGQVYMIDEPENGVHLEAVDTIFDATSTARASQVLVATHSPRFLYDADPEDVLCFERTRSGGTKIIRGDRHPIVREWQGAVNMTVLFAKGTTE